MLQARLRLRRSFAALRRPTKSRRLWAILAYSLLALLLLAVGRTLPQNPLTSIGTALFAPDFEAVHVRVVLDQEQRTPDPTGSTAPYGTDVPRLITLTSESELLARRDELIRYVWRDEGFPQQVPTSIMENIADADFSGLDNLKRIDQITVVMDHGINSIVYLFHPERDNHKLMIYHQGHRGGFLLGKETIAYFLGKGYSVAAFAMPLLGMNNRPVVELPRFGRLRLHTHDHLRYLDTATFSSLRFFLEPVAMLLNYVEQEHNFQSVSMMGVSGGGWTTTLYAAVDPRMAYSYAVAGTLPLYLSSEVEIGDYEESLPEFYRIANYPELYLLGSYGEGRHQVQILNYSDPCCFGGIGYLSYEPVVVQALAALGAGSFEVYLDTTHHDHAISETARLVIYGRDSGH